MSWKEETTMHLQDHIEPMLPATGSEILAACNKMEDVPEDDKRVIESRIDPNKNYQTLDDIMGDVTMKEEE